MTRPKSYGLDDPTVLQLGKFLQNTPLSNGAYAPLPDPISQYVAQAVCNFTQGIVWDAEKRDYVPLGDYETTPEFGDVQVEAIGGGEVVRMTQRSTGISVLGENYDDAWKQLRQRVKAHHG